MSGALFILQLRQDRRDNVSTKFEIARIEHVAGDGASYEGGNLAFYTKNNAMANVRWHPELVQAKMMLKSLPTQQSKVISIKDVLLIIAGISLGIIGIIFVLRFAKKQE